MRRDHGNEPMTQPTANSPEEANEQELANIVSRLADRMQAGEKLVLEQECRNHSKFADDLRDLWGMLVVTQAAGQETGSIATRAQDPIDAPVLKLPFQMGDYLLQTEIGRGGMGVVYHAIRGSDGNAVAIKMCSRVTMRPRQTGNGLFPRLRRQRDWITLTSSRYMKLESTKAAHSSA